MPKRSNPRAVGLFVLGALVLAIVAVAVLGSGRLFARPHRYVLFFDGNVNGLNVGAAVKFKGVTIGSVESIALSFKIPQGSVPTASLGVVRVPVVINLAEGKMIQRGVTDIDLSNAAAMRRAIANGLRAQLAMQSFVTGLLYIDLDLHPHTPARLVLPPNGPYTEIPTLPTTFEEAQSVATKLINQLDRVQLDQLVTTATEALAAVRDLATSPELQTTLVTINRTGQSVSAAADNMRALTAELDHTLGPLGKGLQANSASAEVTLERTQVTLDNLNNALRPDSPLMYRMGQALQDFSAAARSVRQLADYLERNPSAVLRGREPARNSP